MENKAGENNTSLPVIRVHDVSKMYKLYRRNRDRVRDALGLTRKKCYQEHYALDHLSFDVHKGETVGIIGTNGAGKSTILKIITGVLTQTEGEVEIRGRISALLELGAGFNMEYTGIDNIYLNGTMNGFSREEIDSRLDSILSFADIGDFVYQPVKSYSSGMFVRLAFALAINIEPEILIVDEALSVGDAFFQTKCYKKFEEFKKQGKTVVFVSHDLSSISQFCDRVLLLHHGKKLAEGLPNDIINLYKKVLVRQVDDEGRDLTETKALENADAAQTLRGHMLVSPYYSEYGDRRAEIVDFGIVDDQDTPSSTILKGSRFSIKMKVKIHEDIKFPIFAYTIRNLKGVEITGTNTWYERVQFKYEVGDVKEVTFSQIMSLQGGEYLLSLGCTGYNSQDDFEVYHRLYDVCSLQVVSDKNTVGYYDIGADVKVETVQGNALSEEVSE